MDSEFDRERGITPVRAHAELPLPVTPLPRPNTNPRPFDIDAQPREFPKSGSGTASGAFYTLITIEEGPNAGDIHLQGGAVNGEDVTTTSLKLYDLSSDTWEGGDDDQLYLTVSGTGVVADGVLLPGFTVSTITPSIGSPPGDTPPTKDDTAGTAILSLGTFFNGGFFPAVAGNRNVAVCIGSFVKTAGA